MAVPKEYKKLGGDEGGSFARVYKVRHKKLGYVRAIRELKDHIVASNQEQLEKSDVYRKFLRETEVLLNLGNGSHPHIESINSFGTFQDPDLSDEHIAYWERNYIQGNNLEEYLGENGKFVPIEEVVRMAEQISSALAYCHEDAYRFLMDPNKDMLPDGCVVGSEVEDMEKRNKLIDKYKVIHNDIHLKNILRRMDGNYILIDFGMAVEGKEAPTLSRCHGGAEISRAPELWSADSTTEPTTKTDVYSFGVVLYAWLAGQYPFPNDEKLMDAHKNKQPPHIELIRKRHFEEKFPDQAYKRDYPQWLEDVIMKCLKKDPRERFRNGKELHEYVLAHCSEYNNAKYELEKEQLTSKNIELMSDNKKLSAQLSDMRQTNASLNRQLDSKQNALIKVQQTLRDAQDRIKALQEQLKKKRTPSMWILLALFGLWGLGASYYAWSINPTEWERQLDEKTQALTVANYEISELKTKIEGLQNKKEPQTSSVDNSTEITRLTNIIAQKDQKIKNLENQSSKQKPVDNSAEVARLNNKIEQKNSQIKDLESQLLQKQTNSTVEVNRLSSVITKKDQRIRALESEIEDKNKEIKALNNVIGGKNNK